MANIDEGPRNRTKRERIARLRKRLDTAVGWLELVGIVKGLLDLLDDEL
jgi:hypothetical protein